ncbi:hypothetical protein GDI2136 [Gluconacetobacter diazotrophicus PA1 5]|uniref:Uncharacterized protein n=1 Tax=Gluconacetobacter diazotrophicus (strain ATCC 49037 / DSM 5601 / CCUG 37298 / CIP 103539 / LMG 7603 / PAl5) TaxID=272568 RepID=A9HKS7_GLUDA|nr:hypothetical protein GDI2136 [Gluconacetobacter diazotrophicus PA1 5]
MVSISDQPDSRYLWEEQQERRARSREGTGSYPPIFHGLQRKIRHAARIAPRNGP